MAVTVSYLSSVSICMHMHTYTNRWRNGKVVHVQLSEHECEVYRGRVESVVRECRERLAWLKSGSRELFGTILEDKVGLGWAI